MTEIIETHNIRPDEEAVFAVHADAIRQSLPRLNDTLTRLITLSTAMVGGALGFLKDEVCTGWGRVAAAALFFAALSCAVAGSIPYRSQVDRWMEAIRDDIERASRWKRRWVWSCLGLLLLGFVAAIAGAWVRAANPLG